MGVLVPPQQTLDAAFNPLLKLVGVSLYADDPQGIVLYWKVTQLPDDRTDMRLALSLFDARGIALADDAQSKHRFGVPPMEWAMGDLVVEWYEMDVPAGVSQFSVQLTRGTAVWTSPVLNLR
jgi:hypothetical protein